MTVDGKMDGSAMPSDDEHTDVMRQKGPQKVHVGLGALTTVVCGYSDTIGDW